MRQSLQKKKRKKEKRHQDTITHTQNRKRTQQQQQRKNRQTEGRQKNLLEKILLNQGGVLRDHSGDCHRLFIVHRVLFGRVLARVHEMLRHVLPRELLGREVFQTQGVHL